MPGNEQDRDRDREQRARLPAQGGRWVCDYCGTRIKSDGGYRALITATLTHAEPRTVVACSSNHLEELIKKYRSGQCQAASDW